ncbi:MAG: hypothetical protein PW843_03355 [Azospirillaceae bacterium]|nr:hypothetical protein [Azospirillaceae bacterium]
MRFVPSARLAMFAAVVCGVVGCSTPQVGPVLPPEPQLLVNNQQHELVPPQTVIPQDPQFQDTARHMAAIRAGLETPGCLGAPVTRCIATYATRMVIRMSPLWWQGQTFLGDLRPDINGNRTLNDTVWMTLGHNRKTPLGATEVRDEYQVVLQNDPDNGRRVQQIRILVSESISLDLFSARTMDDLHRLGLYDVFYPILADECPSLEEAALLRHIYNNVFQKNPDPMGLGKDGVICGHKISYYDKFKKIPRDERTRWSGKYEHDEFFEITPIS